MSLSKLAKIKTDILCISFVLLGNIFIVRSSAYSDNIVTNILIYGLWIFTFIPALIMFWKMDRVKKICFYWLIFLYLSIPAFRYGDHLLDKDFAASVGDSIYHIGELEGYYDKNGKYPHSINELNGDGNIKLPEYAFSSYYESDGDSFRLKLKKPNKLLFYYVYYSDIHKWVYETPD